MGNERRQEETRGGKAGLSLASGRCRPLKATVITLAQRKAKQQACAVYAAGDSIL